MIPESQLAEWQRLADEATPEPWFNDSMPPGPSGSVMYSNAVLGMLGQHIAERPAHENRSATYSDMRFIATARTALPALIAEVRRLREQLTTAVAEEREACAEIASLKHARVYPIEEYGVRLAIFERIRARGAKEQS